MSDEHEERLNPLLMSQTPLTPGDNPTSTRARYNKPEKVSRGYDEPAVKSRVLKLASIARYTAKRQIATAEKRLATKLLVAGQCSRFPI